MNMKIVVQKFGGTSVSTKDRRKSVIKNIKEAIKEGFSPVVVVSAMGRKGEPYATDTLLSLVTEGFKEENKLATDLLMCTGEIISTVVMSNDLLEEGIEAIPLTGGQAGVLTTDKFSDSRVLEVDTKLILEQLENGKIPVIAGFQGATKEGYFTTLGRGGSDTSAAIIGAALKAEKVEIYTDVDGIMTADPRIVKRASLIDEISYNEVFQLAEQGAKVIHPRAVEVAMKAGIPLIIKNTLVDCKGTVIKATVDESKKGIISGITHMKDRIQITVEDGMGHWDKLFNKIAENNISLDLINIFPTRSIFTIDIKDKRKIEEILENENLEYNIVESCSKISIVGNRMRGVPGVMAKIIAILSDNEVEVLQTADSHMTIWCLVRDCDLIKAINCLHREFNLDREEF